MSAQWPPPPDLASIQDLVSAADVEGLIAGGAPADEYEPEGEAIFKQIESWGTAELRQVKLMPVLFEIWRKSFIDDEAELALRRPKLEGLAAEIERFFGPEAAPQTRTR